MKGFIYIIENNGVYKVGYSKNPQRRLKTLQTGCSNKLKLVYQLEIETAKTYIIEKIIHKSLSRYKVLGEWYKTDLDEIISSINFAKIRYDNDGTDIEYKYKVLRY